MSEELPEQVYEVPTGLQGQPTVMMSDSVYVDRGIVRGIVSADDDGRAIDHNGDYVFGVGRYPTGPTSDLDFGAALQAMRAGKRVRRAAWLPTGHLELDGEKQFMIWPGDCDECSWDWTADDSCTEDILAADWQVCE